MSGKTYTRENLTVLAEDQIFCVLCKSWCWADEKPVDKLKHDEDCPLVNPQTLGIEVRPMTKPREDVCGECDLRNDNIGCPCFRWQEYTHEDLQSMCIRYSEDTRR
jgi:hypothetical protein